MSERIGEMFEELARFAADHRLWGELSATVGEVTEAGYDLDVACSCGPVFDRWISPEMAGEDLLRTRLLAFPNQSAMTGRAGLLLAALGFLRLDVAPEAMPPALVALHRWLDSWVGIGLIEQGMYRQGYDLSLTRYANEGWRAAFYVSGKEHSVTSARGSAWEPTPWRAVQRAAWVALNKADIAAA